jgi:hypothetical protein
MRRAALALCLAALAGCGSSETHAQRVAASEHAAAERRALAVKHEKLIAEVSDMSPSMTCGEWLQVSGEARDAYLLKNWPNLHPKQVRLVTHEQNLGCEVAPRTRTRTAMGPLQSAVDLVVQLGFQAFYEELLAAGSRESVEDFYDKALGIVHAAPPQKQPSP